MVDGGNTRQRGWKLGTPAACDPGACRRPMTDDESYADSAVCLDDFTWRGSGKEGQSYKDGKCR